LGAFDNANKLFRKTRYLNEEVNCTEPYSPSVSFSTYDLPLHFFYKEISFATVSDLFGLACLNNYILVELINPQPEPSKCGILNERCFHFVNCKYFILSSIVCTFLHLKWCWNIPCTLYMEGSWERVQFNGVYGE
jgi:hypothetical protein